MRKSKFTPEQILQALRQAAGGTPVMDICRKMAVTETTVYRWRKQYTGLDVSELRELKRLREENRQLKHVVADLTLDKTILRDALGKNGRLKGTALSAARSWLGPGRSTRSASGGPVAFSPCTAQ